ncbi:hypothetical protein DFJ43DRAFT_960931, partial [Lentinula guzmanii]
VTTLIHILLGTMRPSGKGVFGKVSVYYGVVEAQGRGTLHLHLLIWLKHGLSPLDIKHRYDNDPVWAKKLLNWYDDVFSQSIPEGSVPYDHKNALYKRQPVMSRPLNPSDSNFEHNFNQDLCDILENTGMIHKHNDTCYKYLPKVIHSLRDDDKDCRFQLPRPTHEQSHFDEDGHLVLKCNNGSVNGHNPLIIASERCNLDSKPIGSGNVAMAMFQYMGTYTIKFTLDTAVVFSALCAAIKSVSENPPKDIDGNLDAHERSRKLLVQTVNKLVGKRELSGQQMASRLIGTPSCYTNRTYVHFYWSGMLRHIDCDIFQSNVNKHPDSEYDDNHYVSNSDDTLPDSAANLAVGEVIDADDEDPLIFLQPTGMPPADSLSKSKRNTLFDDIFLRPEELKDVCAWNQMRMYAKQELPKSK